MEHNFGDQEKSKQACPSAEGIPGRLAGLKIGCEQSCDKSCLQNFELALVFCFGRMV